LIRAIYIGVLAMMEDRLSSFLSKTSNELGTQLESLKMIFDMNHEIFYKTAVKGILAENQIMEYLSSFVELRHLADNVSLTGTEKGKLKDNKTGDIVADIE